MTQRAEQVLHDALALPEEDRAGVAYELLESLGPVSSGLELDDAAWLAEIERRARAALAGDPGLSWEDVKTRVKEELRTR